MSSGDDVEAGRVTGAEQTTFLVAQEEEDEDGSDYSGDFVLIVGPAEGTYDNGRRLEPQHFVNGILGIGNHGHYGVPEFLGAVGVVAQGGRRRGTGLLGLAGGADPKGDGIGGIGVHGIGGRGPGPVVFAADAEEPPGPGMLGLGGRQNDESLSNVRRRQHAAGVIGVGGGADRGSPPFDETAGAGVYGVGGDGYEKEVQVNGDRETVGPSEPGPGVVGRGGIHANGRIGHGVVGLSGRATGYSPADGAGVYASGHMGVRAHGDSDRGGMFSADHTAQVQLVPRIANLPAPTATPVMPTALDMTEAANELPKHGRVGDLLSLFDRETLAARLWFCVLTGDENEPAVWREVLLGPDYHGRGEPPPDR